MLSVRGGVAVRGGIVINDLRTETEHRTYLIIVVIKKAYEFFIGTHRGDRLHGFVLGEKCRRFIYLLKIIPRPAADRRGLIKFIIIIGKRCRPAGSGNVRPHRVGGYCSDQAVDIQLSHDNIDYRSVGIIKGRRDAEQLDPFNIIGWARLSGN